MKNGITIWSSTSISELIPRRTANRGSRRYPDTRVHGSSIRSSRKVAATHLERRMDKQNGIYTCNGMFPSLKREWNSDTQCNMDKPWRHYATWNKLVPKRKNTVWFSFSEVLGAVTFLEIERELAARSWEEGVGELLFNGHSVSVLQDEQEFWGWRVGKATQNMNT